MEKKPKKDKTTTSKTKLGSGKSMKPESKSDKDIKIAELEQKWSDRINCLEALLMARTLEPIFSIVKVTPTHSPPAGAVKYTEPFLKLPNLLLLHLLSFLELTPSCTASVEQ